MKYTNVNKLQRFIIYLIDITIITCLSKLCVQGFSYIIHFNYADIDVISSGLNQELNKILNAIVSHTAFDMTAFWDYIRKYFSMAAIQFGIQSLFTLLFVTLYLVVLPMFWKPQTIGRLAMKAKVVNKDGTEVTKGRIVLRELVGTFLFYLFFDEIALLNSIGGMLILASLILILVNGRSLVDYVSKTNLVSLLNIEEKKEEKETTRSNTFDQEDYVDAKFKVLDEDDKKNSSDDEYTIF